MRTSSPGDLSSRRQLRDDHHAIATLLARAGDRRGALEAMDRSVEHAEAIADTDSKNLRAAASRPRAYSRVGAVRQTLGDCQGANEWFGKSAAAWQAVQSLAGFGSAETAEIARAQSAIRECDTSGSQKK
jgi:hypothetical protein